MENSKIEQGLTVIQKEALTLAGSGKTNILFYGGSRAGKTFLICLIVLYRALKYPNSRHLIARLRFSHAKGSIWLDTLRSAVKFMRIESKVTWKEADHYLIVNGSEVWIEGLDDKERVEKILGREYATIFLNEVSQIPYPTLTTVLTRLSQKNQGCKNLAFYDMNPTSKFHWTYKMFIQGVEPDTEEDLNMDLYGSLQMNPKDNADNLAEGYIENILEHLPEDQRRRFLRGEFGDAKGLIFPVYEIVEEVPEEVLRRGKQSAGMDFGFTADPTALVSLYLYGQDLYIDERIYADSLTNQDLSVLILDEGLDCDIFADSAEPKSIEELRRLKCRVRGAAKGPDSIRQGIDWLKSKHLKVTRKSKMIQAELQNYAWKEDRSGRPLNQPIDDFNHAIDAIRYGTEPFKNLREPRARWL